MPLPTPEPGESRDTFLSRCLSSEAVQDEAESREQAAAVCFSQFEGGEAEKVEEVEMSEGLLEKALEAIVNLTGAEKEKHGVLDTVGILRERLEDEFARRNEHLAVREFFPEESVVVYRLSGPDGVETFRVDVTEEDGSFTFGEPEAVRARTTFEPVEAASRPSWSGKDAEGSWSAPGLSDILSGSDIADPDTAWGDLTREQQTEVEAHFLDVPSGGADTFSALGYPVVTASGDLSRRGLVAAKQRASQQDATDVFRMADRLLTSEFDVEKVLERVPAVPTSSPPEPEVLFLSASPSKVDVARGKGLTGPAGATFKSHYLSRLGCSKAEVGVGHLVPELLTKADGSVRQPTESEIHAWRDHLWSEIDRVRPRRIVALGRTAADVLGPVADETLPHPFAVRAHGDSGEIERKLARLEKAGADQPAARKAVLDPTDLPVGPEKVFRKGEAVDRIRRWASEDGSGEKETIDFADYERAFLVRVGEPTNLTSYRLPVADVMDGDLRLMPAAVRDAREKVARTMLPSGDQSRAREVLDELSSRVEKASRAFSGDLVKSDEEKQIAYYTVYAADEVDAHGEWVSPEEIERAAHDYLAEMRHVGKHHEALEDGEVVESYIAPAEFELGGETVKQGDWVAAIRWGDEAWDDVKSGVTPAISMGGAARRVPDREPGS